MIEWAESLMAHHLAYTFLSRAFYEPPTSDFIDLLARDALFDDWPLESEHPDTLAGLAVLREFSHFWKPDGDSAQLKPLARDFSRLFVGPDHLLAAPWESVHRSQERLMFERQTHEVRAMYARYGMVVKTVQVEPEDHVGIEMAFIAYLTGQALNALQIGDTDAVEESIRGLRAFFSEHILQWVPGLLANILEHAETPYYRGIALLTRGCLAQTCAAFSIRSPLEEA
jgi:TorA maturation chaperone TorD